MSKNILIIEDETNARKALAKALEKSGYKVFEAGDGESGLELVVQQNIDLVLCDIRLPGIDGLEVLEKIKEQKPDTIVVMITAFASVERAVHAIKIGAYDFIEKPIDLGLIRTVLQEAFEAIPSQDHHTNLLQDIEKENYFEGMIGCSPAMHNVFSTIIKVAPTRATVLITGETGTGKEMVARAIHNHSNRKGPLIAVNLSALPETLVESELFGTVPGAYTGSVNRKGRLEDADGGTLFIDETGDIPANVQVKLLRVLETRSFSRLGENKPRKVDVRIIAATHVDLPNAINEGKFRQDLYYRLRVVSIDLPPLRKHPQDIPILASAFLQRAHDEHNVKACKISPEALEVLCKYEWPGNIRELSSVIESSAIMAESDTLQPRDLNLSENMVIHELNEVSDSGSSDVITIPLGTPFKDIEKTVIRRTLQYADGNKTKTAAILKISPRTLHRKVKEYNL